MMSLLFVPRPSIAFLSIKASKSASGSSVYSKKSLDRAGGAEKGKGKQGDGVADNVPLAKESYSHEKQSSMRTTQNEITKPPY